MTSDKSGMALMVAAAIVNHREGDKFAGLFLSMLDETNGESCDLIDEYLDLGRAVSRERRGPRIRRVANAA